MIQGVNAQREWTLLEVDVAVRGRSPAATNAVEWFWSNGPLTERHSEFIRHARACTLIKHCLD